MSLINGISGLGAGLGTFAGDALREDTLKPARTPLLNATPAAPVASIPPPQESTPPAAGAHPAAAPLVMSLGDSAAHGNALDAPTLDRAHQIYLGLVARGMDPSTATGFAANAVQESRADPNMQPGDMGASHGAFQWRGDRLAGFIAQNGHAPEKGTLDEQLNYVMHEVSGPEAGAWRNIAAAADDPAAKAAAVSKYWERPKDTAAEIARRSYIANQLAGHFAQLNAPSPNVGAA